MKNITNYIKQKENIKQTDTNPEEKEGNDLKYY